MFALTKTQEFFFKNKKIYIIPNRFGHLYLLVIIIMVLTGATYSNNLIYLLGFFLFSVFASGMVQTHSNLNGTDADVLSIEDAFADQPVTIHLKVINETKKTKQTLRLQMADKKYRDEVPAKADIVESHKSVSCRLTMRPHTRGCYQLGKLKLYTNYPVGLFESWMYLKFDKKYYIYPRPIDHVGDQYRLFGDEKDKIKGANLARQTDTDFREHRVYRPGEPYRHVDWKAFARSRDLLVKTFEGDSGVQKIFVYDDLKSLDPEKRLEQLSFWISESMKNEEGFQLVLPHFRSSMGDGVQHAKFCLRALAEFQGVGRGSS